MDRIRTREIEFNGFKTSHPSYPSCLVEFRLLVRDLSLMEEPSVGMERGLGFSTGGRRPPLQF
jgi:hypothetical protein